MKRKYIISLIAVSLTLALDQYTKGLVRARMTEGESIPIIRDFFSLHFLTNPGAAFGMFRQMNDHLRPVFFLIVGACAMGLVMYYLVKSEDQKIFFPISLSLVMAGAMGNITDRVRFGHVTDFLLFEATFLGDKIVHFLDRYAGGHYWPSFNVSDTVIVIGIFGMAIDLLFLTKEEDVQNSAQDASNQDIEHQT